MVEQYVSVYILEEYIREQTRIDFVEPRWQYLAISVTVYLVRDGWIDADLDNRKLPCKARNAITDVSNMPTGT